MRTLLFALGLLVSFSASAQEAGDTVFAARDVETKRFADAPAAGPALSLGDRLTVLYVDGDRVRISRGDRYGWVAADALTAENPNPEPVAPATPAARGEFDLEALQKLLDSAR